MHYYERSLLYTYANLETIADEIERLIKFKALKSYSDTGDTLDQAERIIALIEKKNLLIELKNDLDDIFSEMKNDDLTIVFHKFTGRVSAQCDRLVPRTYFRKLDRALTSFGRIAERKGLTEEIFKEKYFGVYFIKALYIKAKKEESKRQALALAIKRAKACAIPEARAQ